MYFPDRDTGMSDKDYTFKALLLARLNLIEDPSDENEKEVQLLQKRLQELHKPLSFWPSNKKNDWVRFKKHFEKMYAVLEEAGIGLAKNLTVFEFHTRLEYLKDRTKKEKR